jgi:hypothetical protein
MVNRTPAGAESRYIEKMGEALGTQFYALWNEVVWLHWNWAEFVELFGSRPSRVELLNEAAPAFFRMVQDALWETTLLHIARLTDPPRSGGRVDRANLTIGNLPELIADPDLKHAVSALLDTAVAKAGFCRDWRNRHIAHRDLNLALNKPANPLAAASRNQVTEVLKAIADVLNKVEGQYGGSQTYFQGPPGIGTAVSLLHVLDGGLRSKKARAERLARGEFTEEDYPRDL